MGLFRGVGRFAARETGHLAGFTAIRYGVSSIRSSVFQSRLRLFHRTCPACGLGRMFRFSEEVGGKPTEFYGCSDCAHFEPLDVESDESALKSLQDLAQQRLREMPIEEREAAEKVFRFRCRCFFAVSFLFLFLGFWALWFSSSVWLPLNCAAMASAFFVQGLAASYRYWQLATGMLYQPGAFKSWMASGKWLV